MKRWTILVMALAGAMIVGGWWWSQRSPAWNIVLITLDTTRADHLGCYGHETAVTPHLDEIAAQGVLFENAYTAVPITLPSHATMFTGLLPPEHGLRINGVSRLSDSIPTLAEIVKGQEYQTGAFVSSLVLDKKFGLARGFDVYDDRPSIGPDGPLPERAAAETISNAIDWLTSNSTGCFLCWVHLYDPHEPYEDHADLFGEQFAGRPYDAEIAYMDQHIGRLLQALRRLNVDDRTLIIVAGDHGEGLGEHGEATHGYLTYNSTMRVPFFIHRPDNRGAGTRIPAPVSLADLLPTVLEFLDLASPEGIAGRSLVPYWQGGELPLRPCYGESEAPLMEGGWSPLRTWTTDRWKYIQSTQPELYDLLEDPHELQNLVAEQTEIADQLSEELGSYEAELSVGQGAKAVLTEQEQRALASLGYAGGHVSEAGDDRPKRDIKDVLVYAEQVHECMHLVDGNQFTQAQEILEAVVEAVPEYAKAWGTLGICLARQGRLDEAERPLRKALELDPHQNFARIALGRVLFDQGQFEKSAGELSVAVDSEPFALDAQYYLGEASRRLGRIEEARAALNAALQIEPGFSDAEVGLADLLQDEGHLADAEALYREILRKNPHLTGAHLGLARLFQHTSRTAEAIQMYDTVLARDADHADALIELANLLATTPDAAFRDPSRSIELAERACELTNRTKPDYLRTLAAAYAAEQQLEKAVETVEAALDLVPDSKGREAADLRQDLDTYRAAVESP